MSDKKQHLVIGMGEIGKPVFNILSDCYEVSSYDQLANTSLREENSFDYVHICFGHKDTEVEDFKGWVADYKRRFLKDGGILIIHATVAVGVCEELGAVHSPIVGQHPYLEPYIRKAIKIFGGDGAQEVAELFRRAGLKVLVYSKASESELAKLLLTENYRVNIEFCQRAKRLSDKLGLEFNNVYTLPAILYNQVYKEMGHEEYLRPVLAPNMDKLGGHCVSQNEKLINLIEKC